MERRGGISQLAEELEMQGNFLHSSLLKEIYLSNNYRVGFFWGAQDVPRYPKSIRIAYFEAENEYKVVTIHLGEKNEIEESRRLIKENLDTIPGNPAFLDLFEEDISASLTPQGLRVIGGLEVSNARDDGRMLVSVFYPKPLSIRLGDSVATLIAASFLKSIPVPYGGETNSDLPIN